MSIAQRIKQVIDIKGLSMTDFAKKIGIDRTTITHLIKNDSNPRANILTAIVVNINTINADWLLTGRGKMFVEEKAEEKAEEEEIDIIAKIRELEARIKKLEGMG